MKLRQQNDDHAERRDVQVIALEGRWARCARYTASVREKADPGRSERRVEERDKTERSSQDGESIRLPAKVDRQRSSTVKVMEPRQRPGVLDRQRGDRRTDCDGER